MKYLVNLKGGIPVERTVVVSFGCPIDPEYLVRQVDVPCCGDL
jgi:hypothetical protein